MQFKLNVFKCTQKCWVSQLYSATPVFNVCVSVLFKRLFMQCRVFVMDLISFSVASRIERGLLILVPRPWMLCVNVKNRFHARISRSHNHKFALHVHVALTPIWNTYNRKSFVWLFALASHSRFKFTYRWNTGLMLVYAYTSKRCNG